jgi:hypothetical protein
MLPPLLLLPSCGSAMWPPSTLPDQGSSCVTHMSQAHLVTLHNSHSAGSAALQETIRPLQQRQPQHSQSNCRGRHCCVKPGAATTKIQCLHCEQQLAGKAAHGYLHWCEPPQVCSKAAHWAGTRCSASSACKVSTSSWLAWHNTVTQTMHTGSSSHMHTCGIHRVNSGLLGSRSRQVCVVHII